MGTSFMKRHFIQTQSYSNFPIECYYLILAERK